MDEITGNIRHDGWSAMSIHGNKTQLEQDHVLQEFQSGRAPILVVTDVAARGLDIEDVKFVINLTILLHLRITFTALDVQAAANRQEQLMLFSHPTT